ncbi:MAG TPA: histidine phosphatase family protein [Candidatus Saccharimonadales bacterium]|nr:histidine phosphatase family protein [Candidatus Saccharimonadales bacterium]
MPKTTLILIRHGETPANIINVLHKVNDQDQLTELGIKQMSETAKKLKESEVNALYSSNEIRAKQSADILGNHLNIDVQSSNDLKERNWGSFSGRPWLEVKEILEQLPLEERYNFTPPNGESWQSFEARLVPAINEIVNNNLDKKVVVVTHGGSIRALMPYLLNIPKEESFKYYPRNASVSIFEFEEAKINPLMIDDISHL